MTTLTEFREQFPQYDGVPDQELANRLYIKLYEGKGVSREEFLTRFTKGKVTPFIEPELPPRAEMPPQELELKITPERAKISPRITGVHERPFAAEPDKLRITPDIKKMGEKREAKFQALPKERRAAIVATRLKDAGFSNTEIHQYITEGEGLEYPWIDPVTAFASVTGVSLLMIGAKSASAIIRNALVRGTLAAATDYPIGLVAEGVEQKHPALGFPIAVTLGIIFGTGEAKLVNGLTKSAGMTPKAATKLVASAKKSVAKMDEKTVQQIINELTGVVKPAAKTAAESAAVFKGVTGKSLKEVQINRFWESIDTFKTALKSQGIPDPEKASADKVINIWNRVSHNMPELEDYVKGLNSAQKKDLLKSAIKGKVPKWFKFKIPEEPQILKSELKREELGQYLEDLIIGDRARGITPLADELQRPPIPDDFTINGITKRQAIEGLAKGDEAALDTVRAFQSEFGPEAIADEFYNGAFSAAATGKTLKQFATIESKLKKIIDFGIQKLREETGAFEIGPRTPKPKFTSKEAKNVDALFEKSKKARADLTKAPRGKQVISILRRRIIDTSGNLKAEVEKMGDTGKLVSARHDLIAGAHTKSIYEVNNELIPKIYGGLDEVETDYLDKIIQSRRVIAIEKYKGIKHPGGLGAEAHQKFIAEIPKDLRDKLNKRADDFFEVPRKILKEQLDEGLIDEGSYQRLLEKGDYSPREFLHHVDPEQVQFVGGKKITVNDSGIKPLKGGSEDLLNINSKELMSHMVVRHNARVFRNRANRTAAQLAKELPDNGIFKISKVVGKTKTGKLKFQKKPKGFDSISYMEEGVRKELLVPTEMAKEWVQNDPLLNENWAKWIRRLSGSSMIKPMATGLNPEFALTNFPRDIALVWASDYDNLYSANMIKFFGQMSSDLAAVASDAVRRKGAYTSYIKQGGGMEFLTHQGRITNKISGPLSNLQTILGYFGETSEVMVRLALRNRALKAGLSEEMATATARRYLDFFQGGSYAKAADTALPYLNASIQATRAIGKSAIKNPKLFTARMAQVGMLSTGLYFANQLKNPDAWEQISPFEKANYWIVTTPFSFKDKAGNKKWVYYRVAKDQGQRIFATIFESLAAFSIGEPVNAKEVTSAVQDFFSIVPSRVIPPTFKASLGYMSNYDFWKREPIWKSFEQIKPEREFTRYTHPAFVEAGEYTKLSPERLKYVLSQYFTSGNIYTSLVGQSYGAIFKDMPQAKRDLVTEEVLANKLFVRKVMRTTNPFYKFAEAIKESKIEAYTEQFALNQDFDLLTSKFLNGEIPREEVNDFIRSQPTWRRKSLRGRFTRHKKIFNIPEKGFWLSMAEMPPESRANILYFRYAASTDEERESMEKMIRTVPGIRTKRFVREFNILKKDLTKPQK